MRLIAFDLQVKKVSHLRIPFTGSFSLDVCILGPPDPPLLCRVFCLVQTRTYLLPLSTPKAQYTLFFETTRSRETMSVIGSAGPASNGLSTPTEDYAEFDLLKQLARLPPREAGFKPGQLREPGANIGLREFLQSAHVTPVQRKTLFSKLRRSRSERQISKQSKKMRKFSEGTGVALQRTPGGRGYGQIVISEMYSLVEGNKNASTYRVNLSRDPKATQISKKKEKALREVSGQWSKAPNMADDSSNKQLSSPDTTNYNGTCNPQSSSVIESQEPTASVVSGRLRSVDEGFGNKRPANYEEASSGPLLPLRNAAESSLNIDFDQILQKTQDTNQSTVSPNKSKRASRASIAKSGVQPNVRDFASNNPSRNSFMRAIRGRSKSPSKTDDQRQSVDTFQVPPDLTIYRRHINSIRDSAPHNTSLVPVDFSTPLQGNPPFTAGRPLQRNLSFTPSQPLQECKEDVKYPSGVEGHSKSPSVVSAVSDASSGVVSNAQSVVFNRPPTTAGYSNGATPRKTSKPGPAPKGPLPSLPEGHDVYRPATPGLNESTKRESPERSPVKPPHKSPHRYRLTPIDTNTTRRPASPIRVNGATLTGQNISKPAALVRTNTAPDLGDWPNPPPSPQRSSKRHGVAVVRLDQLPNSASVGALDQRAERTRSLKARDLERMKSQKAEVMNVKHTAPPMPKLTNGLGVHEETASPIPKLPNDPSLGETPPLPKLTNGRGVDQQVSLPKLPSGLGLHEGTVMLPPVEDPHSFQEPEAPWRQAETPWQQRETPWQQPPQPPPQVRKSSLPSDSAPQHQDNILPLSQTLSPIIVVPEPEAPPTSSSTHPSSPPAATVAQEPPPSTPHAHFLTSDLPSSRPNSAHSLTSPRRVPTPFSPSLLRPASHHSAASARSSLIEPNDQASLEARLAAAEKKNVLLERAFLAVVNTSASMSQDGSPAMGRLSGQYSESFRGSGGFEGNGSDERGAVNSWGRESGGGAEGLLLDLETLLARHGSLSGRSPRVGTAASPRLSISSAL